jgi:hypothetical protein
VPAAWDSARPALRIAKGPLCYDRDLEPKVFICGDDRAAKRIVEDLVLELGAHPVDAGSLAAARLIEPAMMLALIPELALGPGLGLAFVAVTIAAVSGVPAEEAGLASGLINTSRSIGGSLGLAALATIASNRTNHLLAGHPPSPAVAHSALTGGFTRGFAVGAGAAGAPGPPPPPALIRAATRRTRRLKPGQRRTA